MQAEDGLWSSHHSELDRGNMASKVRSVCNHLLCHVVVAVGAIGLLASVSLGSGPETVLEPNNSGAYQIVSATWLGGSSQDEIIGIAISPTKEIVLAGNTSGWNPGISNSVDLCPEGRAANSASNSDRQKFKKPYGFIMRLSLDGKQVLGFSRFSQEMGLIRKLHLDAKGQIFVLGDCKEMTALRGAGKGLGTFMVRLNPEATRIDRGAFIAKAVDFALDNEGTIVVLADKKLFRFSASTFAQRWFVTWDVEGRNCPIAVTLAPATGTAVVIGQTQSSIGNETCRSPYAFAFNREGKAIWSLWNPDSKKLGSIRSGGNGLMAHTTGLGAFAATSGVHVYLGLQADGANNVCLRDPRNVDKLLTENVFEKAFQKGPAYGFHGTCRSSVVFRVDANKGQLERGTWLSAWLSEQHANPLTILDITGDATSHQFIVGDSGFGCPTKDPWFTCKPGGFKGGGFLAVFDPNFELVQAGYFPGATIRCIAAADDVVVIAGATKQYEDASSRSLARVFQPFQEQFGGGPRDGYLAILKKTNTTSALFGLSPLARSNR
jgi:hypothetical protein